MYRRLDQVSRDLRFARRQFRRAPGLTLAAVLALGCGIGGLTTVFMLLDAVVLRPLPVAAPEELVTLRHPSFLEVTIPVTMLPRIRSTERDVLTNADAFWLNIMGRLRPGLSIAQPDAGFQTVWAQARAATDSPEPGSIRIALTIGASVKASAVRPIAPAVNASMRASMPSDSVTGS